MLHVILWEWSMDLDEKYRGVFRWLVYCMSGHIMRLLGPGGVCALQSAILVVRFFSVLFSNLWQSWSQHSWTVTYVTVLFFRPGAVWLDWSLLNCSTILRYGLFWLTVEQLETGTWPFGCTHVKRDLTQEAIHPQFARPCSSIILICWRRRD